MTNNQLKALIERIEHLEAEKATIATDIKDVYAEAKGTGFDPKIVKKVIAIRKRSRDEVDEEQALIDTYMSAVGMLADTPFKREVARIVVAAMDQETDQ
jgi:uncharacterized protein (UPF0335 family)